MQISRSDGRQKGKGFAIAGIIISSILLISFILVGSTFLFIKGIVEPKIEQSVQEAIMDFDPAMLESNQTANHTAIRTVNWPSNQTASQTVNQPSNQTANAEQEDDPDAPVPIVGEDENIIVNPAGSGGTRYLLVEIYLLRAEDKDAGFRSTVEANAKQLQDVTINTLRRYNTEELTDPVIKDTIEDRLKALYQSIIGADHPIDNLLVTKWIMQ